MKSILRLLLSPILIGGTVAYAPDSGAQIAPPANLSPAGQGTTSLTLSWDPVDAGTNGPAVYNVRVVDKTDAGLQDPRNNCQPVPAVGPDPTLTVVPYLCVDGLTDTSISLPVKAGHSYDWSVQAIDAAGNRSGLTTASFTVFLPLELTTRALPAGQVGVPYGGPLPATGPVALRPGRLLAIGAVPPAAAAEVDAKSKVRPADHLVDDSQAFSPQLAGIGVMAQQHPHGPAGTTIIIYGSHLRSTGFFVSFGLAKGGTMPVDGHYLKFLDDTRLIVVVPPNLPPGPHDLYAEFPAMGWKGKLSSAFTVTPSATSRFDKAQGDPD